MEDAPQASQEFFFSIAVNRLDANVRRGACIKAIGIVTPHRFFRAFEPLMQAALEECFQELLLPSATPSPSKHQAAAAGDTADLDSSAEGKEDENPTTTTSSSDDRERALASNEEAVARLLRRLNSTTIAANGTGDGASEVDGAPTSVPVLYVMRRRPRPRTPGLQPCSCGKRVSHFASHPQCLLLCPALAGRARRARTAQVSARSPKDAEAQGFDRGPS